MRNVRLVIEVFCFCVTFIFSVILGITQYQQYGENNDISSVKYRKLYNSLSDVYPSFSICLYSSYGMIFKQDRNILGHIGWKGGNLYRKILLGDENIVRNFQHVQFEDVAIDLLGDIIIAFQEVHKGNQVVNEWRRKNSKLTVPFKLSYQDPNQICVTRQRNNKIGSTLNYETLKMDANLLYNITADLHIYIHKLNELTKVLHKPIMSFSLNDFKELIQNPSLNNHYHFNINHIEMIQNRPDGNPPCNKSLIDDDSQFRHVVVQEIGCIPPYWKRFFLFSSQLRIQNFPDCINKNQFRWINEKFLPDLNVENATKLYLKSCDDMNYVITKTKSSSSERKKLILQFNYICEEYKVFQNTKILLIIFKI